MSELSIIEWLIVIPGGIALYWFVLRPLKNKLLNFLEWIIYDKFLCKISPTMKRIVEEERRR